MAEKRVAIHIPRGGDREDPNLFVGINGVNYLIPRGKKSEVPKEVAAEIERAAKAKDLYYETVETKRNAEA